MFGAKKTPSPGWAPPRCSNPRLNFLGWKILLTGTLIHLGMSSSVEAAEFVEIRRTTKVYEEASDDSPVLTELEEGDRVPISKKPYGPYRKVLVQVEGERREGYLKARDLKGQKVRSQDELSGKRPSWQSRFGAGVSLALNYNSQASRRITEGTDPTDVGDMQGTSNHLEIFLAVPWSEHWSFEGELVLRKSAMSGTARLNAVSTTQVSTTQNFLGGAVTGKYYVRPRGSFWSGLRIEASKASSVTLIYGSSTNVDVDKKNYPFFALVQAVAGYDFRLVSDFFLLPKIRAGAVLNAQPTIYIVDVLVSVGYQF